MRYIGSKLKLIDFIKGVVKKYCGEDISDKVFCDLFAGTGIVGRSFSPLVKRVIANDLEYYSYIANKVALEGYSKKTVERILAKFAKIEGNPNLPFAQAYSDGGSKGRMFYTAENGSKIAAVRDYLDFVKDILDEKDFNAALLSIIDGSDAVANTTSVYGAFLKSFRPSALSPIVFKLPATIENEQQENIVYQENANDLIKSISGDILYLDPPYNTRQYSSNYHILNYLAKNIAPETESVAGVTEHNKSKYSSKSNAASELDDLIKNANFEWIFLSYNNEGTIQLEEIERILSKYGEYHVECKEHQRFKADSKRRNLLGSDATIEYVHVLHKTANKNEEKPAFRLHILNETKESAQNEPIQPQNEPIQVEKNEKSFFSELKYIPELYENEEEKATEEDITSKKDVIVSPLNYMGGKKKLRPKLLEKFPKDVNKFVDLFCGGATVGLNASCKELVLNDNLPHLVELFNYFSENDADYIIKQIEDGIECYHIDTQNVEAYQKLKEDYNRQLFKSPIDFFILVAFGFNNQIRFNSRGEYNIPFGKNRSGWNPRMKKNLYGFVNALHSGNIEFSTLDFSKFDFSTLKKGDFVYADPPYLASQATYNSGWNEDSEKELLNKLSELNSRGIKFALSNVLENNKKENRILKDWVAWNNFRVVHLNISYANSAYCRKNKDTVTDEVLIMNY